MGLGKMKVRDGPLWSPLPGRMAWSGSSVSSLTPFPTQKLFSRGEKVGGGSWLPSPPPIFLSPSNHFKLAAAIGFLGPVTQREPVAFSNRSHIQSPRYDTWHPTVCSELVTP